MCIAIRVSKHSIYRTKNRSVHSTGAMSILSKFPTKDFNYCNLINNNCSCHSKNRFGGSSVIWFYKYSSTSCEELNSTVHVYFYHRRDIKFYDEDFGWPDEKPLVIKSNELPAVNNFQVKTCLFKNFNVIYPNVGKLNLLKFHMWELLSLEFFFRKLKNLSSVKFES